MRFMLHYMNQRRWEICIGTTIKVAAALAELMIPYILEYMIDDVVPEGQWKPVIGWGLLMVATALFVKQANVMANRRAVRIARDCTEQIRQDLFDQTAQLSGNQMDAFGLPSLISRMTSDSYNVQNFIRMLQTMGIRAPILLMGGIVVTMTMDAVLSAVLCVLAPLMMGVVGYVSWKGIPLYRQVQERLDDIVCIMRENITGVRVVKALSKADYEEKRFRKANDNMTHADLRAGMMMAIPGPAAQLFLNVGLVLVVVLGAYRVNAGKTLPGVILAFLTYFNMILQSVMAINRIFLMMSKATASAKRMEEVIRTENDQPVLPLTEERTRHSGALLEFDHVSFAHAAGETKEDAAAFDGEQRRRCLEDVSFSLYPGEMLGIIGATGSGKSTIINLLLRFYDAQEGAVYVDGRDVRTYDKDALRRRFGVVFQNDMIFADTLAENISLGREISDESLSLAAEYAMAMPFIREKPGQLQYRADFAGANLSGGQKQRILIARSLAARPEILILDDATSALDYRTDANLRKNLREHYEGVTTVVVAQRISSILQADRILVMDEGRVIGDGTHEELLECCAVYRDIYQAQMGELS